MQILETSQTVVLKKTPLGNLAYSYSERGLHSVQIAADSGDYPEAVSLKKADAQGQEIAKAFDSYFSGTLRQFKIKLDVHTLTEFQHKVLSKAQKIPYGETWTYGELALAVGKPGAQQAIGQVMKRNPLPIIFPCHRVVSSTGLGGFNCGLQYKRILLGIEDPNNTF